MHELIRLLTEFGCDGDTIALAERLVGSTVDPDTGLLIPAEGEAVLSDEELVTLQSALVALGDEDEASAALLGECADAVVAITGEQGGREAAADAEESEREAARRRLRGEVDEDDTAGDGEDESEDGDDGGEATEGDDTGDGDGEGAEAEDRVPVTAAARRPARVPRRDLQAGRPAANAPVERADDQMVVTFAHGVPDVPAGSAQAVTLRDVDRALSRRVETFRRSHTTAREEIPVATVHAQYPEDRRLVDSEGRMLSPALASDRIDAAVRAGIDEARRNGGLARPAQRRALPAAGGICALPSPIYALPAMIGTERRPIRDDALTGFQATRGGVIQLAPPTLADLIDANPAAVSAWTVANDESATDGSPTKPCARVECGDPRESQIEAIPFCLTWGNFMARTWGELPQAWTELGMVYHARFAELRLYNAMRAADITKIVDTETQTISAVRDVLDALDREAASIRGDHRMDRSYPFRVILPETFLGVARTDLARALPGGSFVENLAVAEATIMRFFSDRAFNVTWSPDLNLVASQVDGGPIPEWPTAIDWMLYPEGTFLFLDGGTLDLGLVRDSTLNSTNDVQTFVETFEGVHPYGVTASAGSIQVCPSGATVGTLDPSEFCPDVS